MDGSYVPETAPTDMASKNHNLNIDSRERLLMKLSNLFSRGMAVHLLFFHVRHRQYRSSDFFRSHDLCHQGGIHGHVRRGGRKATFTSDDIKSTCGEGQSREGKYQTLISPSVVRFKNVKRQY